MTGRIRKFIGKKGLNSLEIKRLRKLRRSFCRIKKIIKIYLIGSSLKHDFGQYDPPGFRGSLFSDFDFIIFVEDDYTIPELEKEPDGRPFRDDSINLAYRIKNFIEDKYDAEVFFVRRKAMENKQIRALAEAPGCEIPFNEKSKWPLVVVYQQ